MLVHCDSRAECSNNECVHYEQHEYGEAEILLPNGTLSTSPCDIEYCVELANVRGVRVGSGCSRCVCAPIGDEEDIE